MTKLLMFAGSARKASTNKRLAALAAHTAKEAGAEVTLIDLADFDMPIYNGVLVVHDAMLFQWGTFAWRLATARHLPHRCECHATHTPT